MDYLKSVGDSYSLKKDLRAKKRNNFRDLFIFRAPYGYTFFEGYYFRVALIDSNCKLYYVN